jgi:CRISPR/Cas system CSM-associated protein Csm3 (group 7 of RAMP superfamily)
MSPDGFPFESGAPFVARWTISGSLTTDGPLVIGSGDRPVHQPRVRDEAGKEVDISPVATDGEKRAYIPGTTLKGCLRSWLAGRGVDEALVVEVFGSKPPANRSRSDQGTRGGSAEFRDAHARKPGPPLTAPDWDAMRLTRVATGVSIDRVTRTAAPDRLFHFEYVPPGVVFDVVVSGQTLAAKGEDDETRLARQIALVLFALEGFRKDADPPVTIGAEWGNDCGRLSWTHDAETGVAVLTAKAVASWLEQAAHVGYADLPPLTVSDRLWNRIRAELAKLSGTGRRHLTLGLSLHFDGPFLVNDPLRAKRKRKDGQPIAAETEETGAANHVPLLDENGRAYLPARSIRGALRSQAERILRTLAAQRVPAGEDGVQAMRKIACWPTTRDLACLPITQTRQVKANLCLACQLFGAGGWRSVIQVSRFEDKSGGAKPEKLPVQEFVAIDRFTGGGADHLKFNAEFAYRPVLTGDLTIGLERGGVEPWGLGLLLLTLRDLVEGDIPMGFGRARGYGTLLARVTSIDGRGLDGMSGLQAIMKKEVEQTLAGMVAALNDKVAELCRPGQAVPAGVAS